MSFSDVKIKVIKGIKGYKSVTVHQFRCWKMDKFQNLTLKKLIFLKLCLIGIVESYAKTVNKLTVATSTRDPFLTYNQKREFGGLDVEMLVNFGRRFDVEIEFIHTDVALNEVFASTKLFGDFVKEFNISKFDIFVGALDESNLTRHHLIASRPYFYDKLTWCVQKSQSQPLWKQIFYISKDPWFWLVIIVYIPTSLFFAYFLQRFETIPVGLGHILFAGLSFFLSISYPYNPKNNAHRILLISFLFSCMLFSITFVTFLFRTITSPYRKAQVETIDDILRHDFKLVGDGFALIQLWQQEMRYSVTKLENFEICHDIDLCLERLKMDDHLAVAVSSEYERARRFFGKSNFFCFENADIIYNYGLKILMKKDFQFVNELNRFIQYSVESGLTKKWFSNNPARVKYLPLEEDYTYAPATLAHLTGAFLVIGSVLLSAIFIFLAERIIYKKAHQRNPSTFWIYADMALDPCVQFWR